MRDWGWPAQVDRLREQYAVYLVRSGRICVAGLNSGNVERTATAATCACTHLTTFAVVEGDPAAGLAGVTGWWRSLAVADINGDGLPDLVTGKRYYAHNGKDPGAEDPALAVVFYNRKGSPTTEWQPEVIDTNSGVGCQVLAVDLNGDGTLEFAAGNKKGVHIIGK